MAVGIMSARRRASLPRLCLLCCFLQVLAQGEVFQVVPAHDVFLRSKRANTFLVEEILQGNLERECYEELCNHEEAREYFEDDAKTEAFWSIYYDGNQCEPNPCLNGGNCTDKVGDFHCSCAAPHNGKVCEWGGAPTVSQTVIAEYPECPTDGPTACHQLCTVSHVTFTFTCSCLPGFKLQRDGRSCLPEVEFPCGRLPENADMPASLCHHGNCPWQASVVNSSGAELCGGVLLGPFSVLTAAHCLHLQDSNLQPSNFFVGLGNTKRYLPVWALHFHERFHVDGHDNDLALLELAYPVDFGPAQIHLCLPSKDFCENILMNSGRTGIIKTAGASQTQELVYMTLDECRRQLKVSHPLSNKMFCMKQTGGTGRQNGPLGNQTGETGRQNGPLGNQNGTQKTMDVHTENQDQTQRSQNGVNVKPSGAGNGSKIQNNETTAAAARRCDHLLPGTPVATMDRGTVFLTGLLTSSPTDCGGGLVFTKVSRYLGWIKPRLEAAQDRMTPQTAEYPETR